MASSIRVRVALQKSRESIAAALKALERAELAAPQVAK